MEGQPAPEPKINQAPDANDHYKVTGGIFVLAILGGIGAVIPVFFEAMFLLVPLGIVVIVLSAMSIARHEGKSASKAAWTTLAVIGVLMLIVFVVGLGLLVFLIATCKF